MARDKIPADRLAAILAYNRKRAEDAQARIDLTALQTRLSALGGIDAAEAIAAWKAEAIAAWKADAIAKIDTLPTITRATVKKLLGLE